MSIGFTKYIANKTHWDLTKPDDLDRLDAIKLIKFSYKEFFPEPEFRKGDLKSLRIYDADDLRLLLVRVTKTHILPVPNDFYLGRI